MIDKRIVEFIKEHHVMTIASSDGTDLWCANVFYVYDPVLPGFIFTSDIETRHISLALGESHNIITGSIVLETETVGIIRGLQFRAELAPSDKSLTSKHKLAYLKRFPYAILKDSELWHCALLELKFTDNRLGFGKKICWERPSAE